jgi:hypothetical protein
MTPQERQREVIGFDDNEVEFYPLQMARANELFGGDREQWVLYI